MSEADNFAVAPQWQMLGSICNNGLLMAVEHSLHILSYLQVQRRCRLRYIHEGSSQPYSVCKIAQPRRQNLCNAR